ncbi:MAG: hypothetical protein UR96_C0010G0026 [candidate division WS6 bacterium GW2011_GWC1_36_11]|uniref:Uncharacterized protein n=3 Tax=Candidatus Dojkabacteria TaxID=74243 RepID=A0A0G0DGL9_9BACT|nr:MAG: hypothetical protein UR96_C0010G0026 [candidate division WS6 bacterium GW2011_GWC1_36_11]KKQ04326.1 MAG: hypothetical protein US14_C0015G0011 [candidate division WS6 bacterium GW2011_WS6_36_26]KKQ12224.1 MAG: hypothetical protein US24_C0002G0010 [candidate division WS6 bacterium GW2011_GWC2_36_7]KKQ16814.1 MAG: hypothetical protein US29_C0018G0002 [candidate division WS6 bacterium GW2011_GWF1_36_8]
MGNRKQQENPKAKEKQRKQKRIHTTAQQCQSKARTNKNWKKTKTPRKGGKGGKNNKKK